MEDRDFDWRSCKISETEIQIGLKVNFLGVSIEIKFKAKETG